MRLSNRSVIALLLLLAFDDLTGLVLDPVFATEFLDASGGIDHLLLASEERMAGRTDIQMDFLLGRANSPAISAGAGDLRLVVFGMYSFFHIVNLR